MTLAAAVHEVRTGTVPILSIYTYLITKLPGGQHGVKRSHNQANVAKFRKHRKLRKIQNHQGNSGHGSHG